MSDGYCFMGLRFMLGMNCPTSPQRLLNHCAEFLFGIDGVWNFNGVFGLLSFNHTTTDCNHFYLA